MADSSPDRHEVAVVDPTASSLQDGSGNDGFQGQCDKNVGIVQLRPTIVPAGDDWHGEVDSHESERVAEVKDKDEPGPSVTNPGIDKESHVRK